MRPGQGRTAPGARTAGIDRASTARWHGTTVRTSALLPSRRSTSPEARSRSVTRRCRNSESCRPVWSSTLRMAKSRRLKGELERTRPEIAADRSPISASVRASAAAPVVATPRDGRLQSLPGEPATKRLQYAALAVHDVCWPAFTRVCRIGPACTSAIYEWRNDKRPPIDYLTDRSRPTRAAERQLEASGHQCLTDIADEGLLGTWGSSDLRDSVAS